MQIRVATRSDLKAMDRWSDLKTEPAHLTYVIPGVVGASLIFTTSDKFAFIDNLVSNPLVSSKVRKPAVQALVDYLMIVLKQAGIKNVLAWSQNDTTIRRAENIGFVKRPHTLLIKNMEQ